MQGAQYPKGDSEASNQNAVWKSIAFYVHINFTSTSEVQLVTCLQNILLHRRNKSSFVLLQTEGPTEIFINNIIQSKSRWQSIGWKLNWYILNDFYLPYYVG